MHSKIAIFIYADTESYEGLGRVFNALVAAKELKAAGDTVAVIFDGAGTKWPAELANPAHKAHALFNEVRAQVRGACGFCATVFGAAEALPRAETRLLSEFEGHPSVRQLLGEGFQILNY
jgi:hypothetical protein